MNTVKAFLQTLFILGAVALTVALVYFLTVFGGLVFLGFLLFVMIREYNRSVSERKRSNSPK
jgi:hypothetical protein